MKRSGHFYQFVKDRISELLMNIFEIKSELLRNPFMMRVGNPPRVQPVIRAIFPEIDGA